MNAGESESEVALIVGGGPGISSSCAKRFSREGMRVAVAARKTDKPVLVELEKEHNVLRLPCDASDAESVTALFDTVEEQLGAPIPGRLRSWFFTRGLESGDVDVVLGEDGMHFRLPADSEAIEQEALGS